jgi:hypothetical protein
MPWLNDLASELGLPAGAASVAVAMYAACSAAEKAARPGALEDIARILKDATWSRSVQLSAIIQRIFGLTFGERQLSWKCLFRSILTSLIVYAIIILVLILDRRRISLPPLDGVWFSICLIFILGMVPDYIALAKTRLLLKILQKYNNLLLKEFALVFADIAASLGISAAILSVVALILGSNILEMIQLNIPHSGYSITFMPIALVSTLCTSVWTALILLSTTAIKLLAPLQRFTGWFFDIDKHPLQAIGIVAGALVIIGSGIWAIVRAIV